MIVLDEHLQDVGIVAGFERWYPGQVGSVTALRPGSVIKDQAIPDLLRRQRQPTFVTVNVSDFWRVAKPDRRYCVVAVDLPGSRAAEAPDLVRRLLRRPEFATKALRMGKVVRVSTRVVEYYSADGQVHSLLWIGA
jgi:hypothetical protein